MYTIKCHCRGLTVILIVFLHQVLNIYPEVFNIAHLPHLFSREQKLGHVSEVLAHGPERLLRVDIGPVPLQEFLGGGDVLGDRLLG
jgi:hypothetical protein